MRSSSSAQTTVFAGHLSHDLALAKHEMQKGLGLEETAFTKECFSLRLTTYSLQRSGDTLWGIINQSERVDLVDYLTLAEPTRASRRKKPQQSSETIHSMEWPQLLDQSLEDIRREVFILDVVFHREMSRGALGLLESVQKDLHLTTSGFFEECVKLRTLAYILQRQGDKIEFNFESKPTNLIDYLGLTQPHDKRPIPQGRRVVPLLRK